MSLYGSTASQRLSSVHSNNAEKGTSQDSGYGLCSAVMKDEETQEQEKAGNKPEKADDTGHNLARKEERKDGTDEPENTHDDLKNGNEKPEKCKYLT